MSCVDTHVSRVARGTWGSTTTSTQSIRAHSASSRHTRRGPRARRWRGSVPAPARIYTTGIAHAGRALLAIYNREDRDIASSE